MVYEDLGKKVRDLTELVDTFQAQEGEVQQIIGKTGNGKTYEGTRRALDYLRQGFVVYTTWQLILPEVFDERESIEHLIFKTAFFKKRFYRFDFRKNWHYLDIDRPDLIEYVANITDAIVFMDEGQDVFDARGGMDRPARKTITRTRHMRKTLIIISQRAQAVDVTARANVTYFYKCVKTWAWFWPFRTYFKVYRTEEMDDQNYPIWEERMPNGDMWSAPVWHSHFADQKVYDAYNSWYLRAGKEKSQEVHFDAFDLTLNDKIRGIFTAAFGGNQANKPRKKELRPGSLAEKLSTGYPQAPVLALENAVEYEHGTTPQSTPEEGAPRPERHEEIREPRQSRRTLDLRRPS
jgi:hypothetical protein